MTKRCNATGYILITVIGMASNDPSLKCLTVDQLSLASVALVDVPELVTVNYECLLTEHRHLYSLLAPYPENLLCNTKDIFRIKCWTKGAITL